MFRDTKDSAIDPTNFGVGSFVQDGSHKYLVIGHEKKVTLLDMRNFKLVGKPGFAGMDEQWVSVQDPNFFSEAEARAVCNLIQGATFSDHELKTIGLKEYDSPKNSSRGVGITKL